MNKFFEALGYFVIAVIGVLLLPLALVVCVLLKAGPTSKTDPYTKEEQFLISDINLAGRITFIIIGVIATIYWVSLWLGQLRVWELI